MFLSFPSYLDLEYTFSKKPHIHEGLSLLGHIGKNLLLHQDSSLILHPPLRLPLCWECPVDTPSHLEAPGPAVLPSGDAHQGLHSQPHTALDIHAVACFYFLVILVHFLIDTIFVHTHEEQCSVLTHVYFGRLRVLNTFVTLNIFLYAEYIQNPPFELFGGEYD